MTPLLETARAFLIALSSAVASVFTGASSADGWALFGITVAHPAVLLLLLLLPLWSWWRRRAAPPRAIPFSRAAVLAAGPRPSRAWERWAPGLRTLAMAGFIVAAAQPRSGARAQRVASEGIDIALVVDISSSMLAEDFQPQNRIEVAKEKVKRFVVGRTSDRVGLVAFSGEALTQVPLTTDYPVVLAAVDNLQVGQLEDGTAIGTAIATAANRLRTAPGRSRVMVLLTDGENNRGAIDPRTAAQAAGAFGIRIYAIGVGSEGMAAVPVGRGLFGLRYENRPVKIDEALLTEIAANTGGRYFRARDAEALQRIYEQIDALEKSIVEARAYIRYTERFRWPLLFGLAALLAELALRARRGVLP
jgi:Ca-activated chloride channel family protein